MNKVPVPVFRQTAPTDVVDIDADTLEDLKNRSGQAQLARAGIQALGSVLGSGAGYAMNASMKGGMAPALLNVGAGGILGRTAATPVANAVANRMMQGPPQRYRDEIKSQLNDREQLDEFAPGIYAQIVSRMQQANQLIAPTLAAVGGATLHAAELALGKEKVDEITDKLFPPLEDESRPADLLAPTRNRTKLPIDDPSRRRDPVRPGTFVDTFVDKAVSGGLRYTGPNSASGRSATHALDTDVGGLSFKDRLRKAKFQQRQYQAKQSAQRNQNRKRTRRISIGLAVSLAALLAAGFTVAQVSKVVQNIRRNMRTNQASFDIVKLASQGDTEGAQMLMNREFEKAAGVNVDSLADATEGLSKKELKMAAQILKRELT